MSVNGQYQNDRNTFIQRAQRDGLNIQQIQQQAISTLPSNATQQQKDDAIQAETLQAVQKTGDSTLAQNYQQLQNDHAEQLKKGPPKGGKPPGGADQTVEQVIQEGDSATVSEIQSCLSGMKSDNKNYATLQSMLQTAQSKEQQNGGNNGNQPPPPPVGVGAGSVLNFLS